MSNDINNDPSKLLEERVSESAVNFTEKLLEAHVAEVIVDYFDNFFAEMAKHQEQLDRIQELKEKKLKEEGIPGVVTFDIVLYHHIVHHDAPPAGQQLFTHRWPSLNLTADALETAIVSFDQEPTPERLEVLKTSIAEFNEAFSSFETDARAILDNPPKKATPKSPPDLV